MTVSDLLKLYFRSLPEPLLTPNLYEKLVALADEPFSDEYLKQLSELVGLLPKTHYLLFRFVCKWLKGAKSTFTFDSLLFSVFFFPVCISLIHEMFRIQ